MSVDAGLAQLSDTLFTSAIATYSIALVSYCGEYAFGRKGRIARTAVAAADRTLVGASVGGSEKSVTVSDELAAGLPHPDGDRPAAGGRAAAAGGRPAAGSRAERFGRLALAFTVLGLLLHGASLVVRGVAVGRVPWGNMYEFSSAVGLVAVVAFVAVLIRQPQVRYLGMFVMLPVIVLMFLAGTVLYAEAAPLMASLRSYWLVIHVAAAVVATGIFLVSFVATTLFLVRSKWDAAVATGRRPKRFPTTLGWRLPEAGVLDRVAYRTVAFGFPIWTFAIITGAIWAEAAWGRYWGWDPKETWAFVAWVVYAAYLHARATAGWRGVVAARINLVAFGAMIFNFFVINIVVSGLHSYAGVS